MMDKLGIRNLEKKNGTKTIYHFRLKVGQVKFSVFFPRKDFSLVFCSNSNITFVSFFLLICLCPTHIFQFFTLLYFQALHFQMTSKT